MKKIFLLLVAVVFSQIALAEDINLFEVDADDDNAVAALDCNDFDEWIGQCLGCALCIEGECVAGNCPTTKCPEDDCNATTLIDYPEILDNNCLLEDNVGICTYNECKASQHYDIKCDENKLAILEAYKNQKPKFERDPETERNTLVLIASVAAVGVLAGGFHLLLTMRAKKRSGI